MLSVKKNHASAPAAAKPGGHAEQPWSLEAHWPELVAGLADQITEGVSALQNSIDQLLAKDRITSAEHRSLSIPTQRLKMAGVSTQQIHRMRLCLFSASWL